MDAIDTEIFASLPEIIPFALDFLFYSSQFIFYFRFYRYQTHEINYLLTNLHHKSM